MIVSETISADDVILKNIIEGQKDKFSPLQKGEGIS